jgi:hypothetical protein
MNEQKFPTDMAEQFAQMMKSSMPQVKASKNGYEIRTKVLGMAHDHVWQDFHAKWSRFETLSSAEVPEVPNAETVLETANKFYEFINGKINS